MKVRRKFSLRRIGIDYETVDIEMAGENISDIIDRIDDAWKLYKERIEAGQSQ